MICTSILIMLYFATFSTNSKTNFLYQYVSTVILITAYFSMYHVYPNLFHQIRVTGHLLAFSSESIPEATAEARGPRRWEWWRSSLHSSPPPLPPQNVCPRAGLSPSGLGSIPQAAPPRVSLGQEVPAYPEEAREREARPWAKGEGPFHSRQLSGEAIQDSQGRGDC